MKPKSAWPKASPKARGYGYRHQKARKLWKAKVDAGGVFCARCWHQIFPFEAWDLDHSAGKQGYLGPSHRRCNRVAGGRQGVRVRNARKRLKRVVSRRW
jgi:hypothetical protein